MTNKQRFDYDAIPGDYQYKALTSGPRLQRFWHKYKLELLSKVMSVKSTDTVLDIGCGSGNLLFHVSRSVYRAYGLDINQEAIHFCRNLTVSGGLTNACFFRASAKAIPFRDASVEILILAEVIEHLEEPFLYLAEVYRVLKPGGRVFITTPNYGGLWPLLEQIVDWLSLVPKMRNEQHITRFRMAELESLLKEARFRILKSGTFYAFSPLGALVSEKLASRLFAIELRTRISSGLLMYCVAYKDGG